MIAHDQRLGLVREGIGAIDVLMLVKGACVVCSTLAELGPDALDRHPSLVWAAIAAPGRDLPLQGQYPGYSPACSARSPSSGAASQRSGSGIHLLAEVNQPENVRQLGEPIAIQLLSPKKTVGVVATPARTPVVKSRRTRASTRSLRRSCSKRSRSKPSCVARCHRCGSSSRLWWARSRSSISQEAIPESSRLRRARRFPSARVRGADREMPHHEQQLAGVDQWSEAQVQAGAVRTLQVRVLDQQWCLREPADMVVVLNRGQRGRAEYGPVTHRARRQASSASKIRFAPGRSPGESA